MTVSTSELRDSARQVLREMTVPADEEKTWSAIVELGWLLVSVPEDAGGLGQGLDGACAFHRELGNSLSAAPYLPAMLAIDAISNSEIAERESWIEKLVGGEFVTASLVQSALTGSGAGKLRLSGTASAVPSADKASHVLVCLAQEATVALVPLGSPGMEVTRQPTWDVTRRLYDIRFADVAIDDGLVLARGAAAETLARKLDVHRDFALAADSVGAADALLEMTLEYLRTRRQYGRPLALFQALKHRCADLKASLSAAEALLVGNLDRLDGCRDAALVERMGKQTKSLASSVFMQVAEEALQLHGGIGMTSEYPCHYYLKRALLNAHLGRPSDCYDVEVAASILSGF